MARSKLTPRKLEGPNLRKYNALGTCPDDEVAQKFSRFAPFVGGPSKLWDLIENDNTPRGKRIAERLRAEGSMIPQSSNARPTQLT